MQTGAFSFHDPGRPRAGPRPVCLTETLDRQIGFYGLDGGRVAVFAVYRTEDPALPEARAKRCEHVLRAWVDLAERALAQCPPSDEIYYDQVAQIDMPRGADGRVGLVGDAAYAVSLLAGQGASLAIAGAFVLADRLREATSVEHGLEEYERIFRPVAEEKQRVAVKAVRWFLPHTRTQLRIRRAALTLARIPVFTRYVAGAVTGEACRPSRCGRPRRRRAPARLPTVEDDVDGDH